MSGAESAEPVEFGRPVQGEGHHCLAPDRAGHGALRVPGTLIVTSGWVASKRCRRSTASRSMGRALTGWISRD
jgi:hypothetical protein